MSLLDALFRQTSSDDLKVSGTTISAEAATVTAGYVYLILATDTDVTLTLASVPIADVAGKRVAVKVATGTEGPGGDLTVTVPGGQYIEGDDGNLGSSTEITLGQTLGNYREWLCSEAGTWLLVAGTTKGGGAAPPASTYEQGGTEEIDVSELNGELADAQPVAIALEGTLVATRSRLNLHEGYGITIAIADDLPATPDEIDITVSQKVADAAAAFAWSSNAASLNVAAGRNFAASNTLTGNSALTLASGVDGCQGMIFVKQDATGGRTLSFTIAGRTVRKDLNVPDTNPLATANAETVYQYFYYTLAGTAYVMLNKVYLA